MCVRRAFIILSAFQGDCNSGQKRTALYSPNEAYRAVYKYYRLNLTLPDDSFPDRGKRLWV